VLTLTSAYYMNNVNNFLSNDRKMYLDEVSNQNAETLRTQIQDDINTLKSISLAIDAYNGLTNEKFFILLNNQAKLNNFKRISLTTPGGKTYSSDGKSHKVPSPLCITKSLNGEISVCGPIKDHQDGNNVFVYSIPVYKNKTLIYSLSAIYDAESFVKDLDMSNFGEDAFFIITNKNGDMILNSNKPNSMNTKANIFDQNFYQRGEFKDYSKIKANENMFKTGKSGFIKFSDLDQEKILNYTPLKINDWYLLTIINTTHINSKNQHIVQTTLALCMSSIVIITCLVILIRYLHTKNKREVETIYYMDNITRGNNFNKFAVDSKTILKHSHHKTYAVVTFDIDKFKYVNDVFGF
ncbi:MAG: hypothetical protein RSA01_06115, partial [Clostridium sp.]